MTWKIYKNKQGARRADGFYIRRAWSWYPSCVEDPRAGTIRGWDICLKLRVWATYPDQTLDDVMVKVDSRFPKGTRRYRGVGRRISMWKCGSCDRSSLLHIEPTVQAGTVTCVHCDTIADNERFYDSFSLPQVELLPDQYVSSVEPKSIRAWLLDARLIDLLVES